MRTFTPDPSMCKCKKCLDTGFDKETGKQCECVNREYIYSLFRSAQIPKRFRTKTLDNFDQKFQLKAYKKVREYLNSWNANAGRGLFLTGPVGTGKSHLAYGILREMVKKQIKSMAATVPDLLDDLKPKEDRKGDTRMEILKRIDFLLLDDLGAQRNTAWVTERLFVIVNARYSNMLPTVFTSNVYLEDLEKTPGWERITDRILETCDLVIMPGKSYRRRLAEGKTERE